MNGGPSQAARVMAGALAELEADVWSGRERAVIHARAHLAQMTPERRALLEAEWEPRT